MADLATLKARFAEAEEALHRLALGEHVVWVTDHNGEQVRYQRADMSELRKYIDLLKAEIAAQEASSYPSGPLHVWF